MSTWDPNPRQLMVLGWDEEMWEGREKEGRNDGKRGIDGRKREKIRRNDGKKGIGEGEGREKRGFTCLSACNISTDQDTQPFSACSVIP